MKIEDTFVVDAPASEVYAALLDLERVAPCVPGADGVEKLSDTSYKARIRLKVGPITMQYRAEIDIIDQDPEALKATMKVKAKETRGQGSAEAITELSLTEVDGKTNGVIGVDVNLTGRAASMGQGAIKDVSSRLVAAFAGNLGSMLEAPAPAAAATAPGTITGAPVGAAAPAPELQPAPAVEAEPLSVGGLAGDMLKDRIKAGRVAGVVGLLAFIAGWLAGHRRRG